MKTEETRVKYRESRMLFTGSLRESFAHLQLQMVHSAIDVKSVAIIRVNLITPRVLLRYPHSVGCAECGYRKKPREKRE